MIAHAAVVALAAKAGYSLTEQCIGDAKMPALLLSKEGSENSKRPAVILVHGGGIVDALTTPGLPYKEEWFRPVYEDVPYRLAGKGMLVVAIDAAWAESRLVPEAREEFVKNPMKALFTDYIAGVRDISHMLEYLCERPDVDPARIGVAGKSGGALVSLMAACQEPRLAAVVSWKGGADFVELTRLRDQQELMDAAFERNPEFREILERADPINNFERIPPKALALINIREDPLMPRAGAEALYERLRPLYEEYPGRLVLKLCDTPKPTHDDQVEAFDAGCQWLEDHLLPRPKDEN